MWFFKSGREKTLDALEKLARQCADEAVAKRTETINELREASLGDAPVGAQDTVSTLNKVYRVMYNHDIGTTYGYRADAEGAYLTLSSPLSMGFAESYLYFLYLNLIIRRIQANTGKHISQEALFALEKYGLIPRHFKRFFHQLFPKGNVFYEQVEKIVYKHDGYITVKSLYKLETA